MGRVRKLYKKMRHIHLRFQDNGFDCDLSEPLAWLYLTAEEDEPLHPDLVTELERILDTCDSDCRHDIEKLLDKARELDL